MTKYEIIFEALQDKVNSGELSIEEAELINEKAYEKYREDETEYEEVTESTDEHGVTYEEYLESMEEELFDESTRYKKEQEKLARNMDAEEKNIQFMNMKDNDVERVARTLRKNNQFENQEARYNQIKKEINDRRTASQENLDKMKKSKLYTGDEKVLASKNGKVEKKKMHIGSTLYYGKARAKEIADERDDIKKYGIAFHDATYDELEKQKINVRKKLDHKRGLKQ